MRAFVVTGPGRYAVEEVPDPAPSEGQVVVDVERVGVCGTDAEFFSGEMAYLHQGHAAYPLRLGHEWCGTISAVGPGVSPALVGTRTTGDTMLGCGHCRRCLSGRQHLCDDRYEIGIRGGWPGALASQLVVPASSLHALPSSVDSVAGALVEPGGNALRAVRGAALSKGSRVLVLGPGTIGLLCALFAQAAGAAVQLAGVTPGSLAFARSLEFDTVSLADGSAAPADAGLPAGADSPPAGPFDAVIDASNGASSPALAVDLVEPGGRVVFIGLSGAPSLVDSRDLALKDVTAVGVLSASGGLAGAIEAYASGVVDPRPLVAATVSLDGVGPVLAGSRPAGAGPGPKLHVDPRLP
ncbi:zinc-dependent alcohol dehydrogenase [Frondihabitans australicus]|uniref:D-arabinose 1-dehydrogenase-like Zn-dependent alcohol dehydrogenase n=1 Tax=Frondihabitans australicus TaxID=386892 RepID=A0A495IBX8_9MICO|nr:alcohol dehydrogenase catalytic domain-containing protein [Frondihabitans australicus]RKR73513.1 D-arabinose 1-dehydrogenase-like Zn-dependent alcohol dehydrogenase [Frondihabitans australicus]